MKQRRLTRQAEEASSTSKTPLWIDFASTLSVRSRGSVVPFVPYGYQAALIDGVQSHSGMVILKSRQMGVSETLCSYMLYRCVYEPGFTAVVISKTQQDSSDLAVRIRLMAASLTPPPLYVSQSKLEIALFNGGRIKFLSGSPRAARGIPSCSFLWFDEAAFIDGIEEIYQAAAPTLSLLGDKGRIIFNSTPNGRSGLFYDLWMNSDWHKQCLHYGQMFKTHTLAQAWAARTKDERRLTDSQWQQEYELDFSETDATIFSEAMITQAEEMPPANPHPKTIVGIDPSFGGSDYFVALVFDVSTPPYRLVGQCRERKRSLEHSLTRILSLLQYHRPFMVSVECNTGGNVILEELVRRSPRYRYESVITTTASKRVNTDRLVLLLEKGWLRWGKQPEMSLEFRNFRSSERGKREAAAGYNDDLVMAAAACFAHFEPPWRLTTQVTPVYSH